MAPTQRLPPVKRFIAIRIVPAFTIVVSLFAIVVGAQSARLARESRTWPAVDGVIVRSEIAEEFDRSSRTRGVVTYRPLVHYRYRVAGVEYAADRVAFGEYATNDRSAAEAVLERYPIGRRLPVHVRPTDAGTAVLEVGDHGLPWFYLALGAAFLSMGLLLAWISPKLIAPL